MPVGAIILVAFCFLSSPTPLGMGLRKSSQLATAFWLLVRASATVQSNNVTSNGFNCVRFFLTNRICLDSVLKYEVLV